MIGDYVGNGNLPDDWNEAAFERYWGCDGDEYDDEDDDWLEDDDHAEWE